MHVFHPLSFMTLVSLCYVLCGRKPYRAECVRQGFSDGENLVRQKAQCIPLQGMAIRETSRPATKGRSQKADVK